MPIPVGTYRFGPDNATLAVNTGRIGKVAQAGHDLLIHVTAWEGTLTVGQDAADTRIERDRRRRVDAGHRGHRRHEVARRRRQGEHRPDHRRGGAHEAGRHLPLDARRAGGRGPARGGRPDAARPHAAARVRRERRRRRDGVGRRSGQADRLRHEALLGALRRAQGRRRGQGHARGDADSCRASPCRPPGRRGRPRLRAEARPCRARRARRPRLSPPGSDRCRRRSPRRRSTT